MEAIKAIILGLVQGLTEFLPVSSSGHLVIAGKLLNVDPGAGILFETLLHLGTFMAVIFYFRKRIKNYFNIKFITLIIIGTIPAGLAGIFGKDFFEALFINTKVVGVGLVLTGIFNLTIDLVTPTRNKIGYKNALFTGLGQALSIVPGISRSGTTIFTSVIQGIKKDEAAEFSFLLSLPAVFGASVVELMDTNITANINWGVYILGIIAAFLSGLAAIYLVFKFIQNNKFKYFGYYCLALGFITLLFL